MNSIASPLPHFSEAANAAKSYLGAKREHLMLAAELRAKHEGKRAAYLAGAAMAAIFALSLFFFWITFQIHEAGAPSWTIALGCLAFFGGLGLLLFELSKTASQVSDEEAA